MSSKKPTNASKQLTRHSPISSVWGRIKEWFGVERQRNWFIVICGVIVLLLMLIPPIKFGIFNSLGVRGAVSVHILDASTDQPLKNVTVTIGQQTARTDRQGRANLTGIRLGKQAVMAQKIAYATFEGSMTVKTGQRSLQSVRLKPTGSQYEFILQDWLSSQPLAGAEVTLGESSSVADTQGRAVLTTPPQNQENFTVLVTADEYRQEEIELAADQHQKLSVDLVADTPHFFISERSGNYDLYKIDADGQNEQLVLAGSGQETANLQLVQQVDKRAVYLVSSRAGRHNDSGSILYELYRIDPYTFDVQQIDQSESLRLYGLSQGRLIYVKVRAAASASNPNRQELISYDPQSGQSLTLDSSNYFNSITVTDSAVYYAPSDFYKQERQPYLFRADPVNAGSRVVHAAEVWSIFRTGYNQLTFDAKQDWYTVAIDNNSAPIALDGRPADLGSRLYRMSPNGQTALWVDVRDGKGYLLAHDITNSEDNTVHIQAGLRHPLTWLNNDQIVYRVTLDGVSSDYVIDRRGGDPQKISDVADIPSYDRWYYYY